MTATTFETFDLLTSVDDWMSARDSVRSDPSEGPIRVRQKDPRPVRAYRFRLPIGTASEAARLRDLWNLTAGGVLPMLWNHPVDGNVAVYFDQDELEWTLTSATSYAVDLKLTEFLG